MWRRHPILYEINTRVWLGELSRKHGRPIDLGSVPEEEIEQFKAYGLDAVWLMGVWAPSPASRKIALRHTGPSSDYRRALPNLRDEDVIGSPFAVFDYSVSDCLGGDAGLRRFRERLAHHNLRLMLDFVPNHLAMDHGWTQSHPAYLVHKRCPCLPAASPEFQADAGTGYFTRKVGGRQVAFAHGRDPYFPPWTDTVQVDYNNPAARSAMIATLQTIADRCDGARCDMAMLVTNDVYRRTWDGINRPESSRLGEFWEEAIPAVRARRPDFLFLAEVYWDLEQELLRQGFDYAYDKGLYDGLLADDVSAVRDRLRTDSGLQNGSALFIENHDERRAVDAFGREKTKAAAVLIATLPGLRLFHEGQFEGRRTKLPVQLGRLPVEKRDVSLEHFYRQLLNVAGGNPFHDGDWRLLDPHIAWPSNGSFRNIIAYTWTVAGKVAVLTAVNLGARRSQARVPLTWPGWAGRTWALRELLDQGPARPAVYRRDGDRLLSEGLFVDLEPYAYHLLSAEPIHSA